MPGYPDWQGYSNWRSPNMMASWDVNLPAGVSVIAQGAAQSWQSLMVRINSAGAYGTVSVTWYLDSGYTQQIGSDTWQVTVSCGLFVIVPCEAPYVQVTFNNLSGAANPIHGMVQLANNQSGQIYYPVSASDISAVNVAVPASGSVSYRTVWLRKGWAQLYFAPADTAGKLNPFVAVENYAQLYQYRLTDLGEPTAEVISQFLITDAPLRIEVVNNDTAAAHTFSLSFVVD